MPTTTKMGFELGLRADFNVADDVAELARELVSFPKACVLLLGLSTVERIDDAEENMASIPV
eukprot:IDg9630t1